MAASRFRPPKSWTPAVTSQPAAGCGIRSGVNFKKEKEEAPALRVSRTGICNKPRKQREALRKERKADPNGFGVHSWRRRQWVA